MDKVWVAKCLNEATLMTGGLINFDKLEYDMEVAIENQWSSHDTAKWLISLAISSLNGVLDNNMKHKKGYHPELMHGNVSVRLPYK